MICRVSVLGLTLALIAAALLKAPQDLRAEATITPEEARAIAKEAYTYANPVVDSYRVIHGYFLDPETPAFKAPLERDQEHPRGDYDIDVVLRLYVPDLEKYKNWELPKAEKL